MAELAAAAVVADRVVQRQPETLATAVREESRSPEAVQAALAALGRARRLSLALVVAVAVGSPVLAATVGPVRSRSPTRRHQLASLCAW